MSMSKDKRYYFCQLCDCMIDSYDHDCESLETCNKCSKRNSDEDFATEAEACS